MPSRQDYNRQSRFRADPEFRVVTRGRQTVASILLMKPPLRSPGDRIYTIPLRFQFRWDLLANELLGDPILRWVLMRHNRVSEPFSGPIAGRTILVPSARQVAYYLNE